MFKSVENFVKWVDKDSKTDALKMVFSWNDYKSIGEIHAYTCSKLDMVLEKVMPCSKKEFDLAKKMPPELLATLVLG